MCTPHAEPPPTPPTPTPPTSAWLPMGQAMAEVIENSFLIYLKDKRDISIASRFMNAYLGGLLFYMSVLFQRYSPRVQDQTETSIDTALPLNILEPLATQNFLAYLAVAMLMAVIVAPVIAYGIKNGGPLRFFFAGATVPALVFFIASRLS